MQRLHTYPDIRAMFRRLLIATITGALAALAVAVFRHAMYLLEWVFLSNESGSLVDAAAALSPWRRVLTPALGGLAAGLLLWGWQRLTAQRPHAPTDYMEALETGDGQFDYGASLVKSLASLLVVASGSAIGREGAMILLAALAASCFAQRFTPKSEWKLWIACGAAAGMAFCNFIIYILHLFLSFKFGLGLSLFWGVFESLQCILYSNIELKGVARYIPFAWSMNWVQDILSRQIFNYGTEKIWIAALTTGGLLLTLLWFSHWEGRKNYE